MNEDIYSSLHLPAPGIISVPDFGHSTRYVDIFCFFSGNMKGVARMSQLLSYASHPASKNSGGKYLFALPRFPLKQCFASQNEKFIKTCEIN